MSELEEARVLRNSRREGAREIIGTLSWLLTRYSQLEKEIRKGRQLVTVTEKPLIRALRSALHKAEESLEEYEESIVGVMALEGLEDWDEENEHAIESREISDKLDTLGNDVVGLTAHFKEDEDNEEIFNEVYNELAEKYEKAATEAQATFDLVKKYEAGDSGQQVEREEVRRHSKTSDRARLSTYKASGIGSGNRYRATNVRFGNRYRYKDGNVRSGNKIQGRQHETRQQMQVQDWQHEVRQQEQGR